MQDVFRSLLLRPEPWTIGQIVLHVCVAFLLGIFIAWVYRATHRQMSVSFSFVNTLVLLSMMMSIVIMVIGDNIARAFGLAGAMSIIRFRTVVKDTRDTAYVFFSLGAGMAAGTGNLRIALGGTLLVGLFVGVLHWTRHGAAGRDAYLLGFEYEPTGGEPGEPYLDLFRRHLESWRLISARSVRAGAGIHHTFHVHPRPGAQVAQLLSELGAVEGVFRAQMSLGEESEV